MLSVLRRQISHRPCFRGGLWLILLCPRILSVKSAHRKVRSLHRAFYGERPSAMSKLEQYLSMADEILLV